MKTVHNCCLCSRPFHGYGNNPYPFAGPERDRACDSCNDFFVTPARLRNVDKLSLEFLRRLARFLKDSDIEQVADFLSLGYGLAGMRKDIAEKNDAIAQASEMATALKTEQ